MSRRRLHSGGLTLVCVAALFLWSADVAGALELSVRGESQIELETSPAGTTLLIRGQLRDDLGDSLAGRSVETRVRRAGEVVFDERGYADYHGRFSTAVELAPGQYEVEVEYAGARHVVGTSATEAVEVEEAPTEVRLGLPNWVHGAQSEVLAEIEATAGGQGLASFVSLSVNASPVASIDLDEAGRASIDLAPYLSRGVNQVDVVVPASEYREAASASGTVRRVDELEIAGESERVFRRLVRGVSVALALRDEEGPIPGAEVDFLLRREDGGDELLMASNTGVGGRAEIVFPDDQLGEYNWDVSARVTPPAGEPVDWQGDTVRSDPSPFMAIVRLLGLLVLAGCLLWLGRRGLLALWARFDAWRQGRNDEEDEKTRAEFPVLEEAERVELSPVPGEERVKLPQVRDVHIQLWDEWRDQPVDAAELTVIGDDGERREVVAEEGTARLESLSDGLWKISVVAPGFVDTTAELQIPSHTNWLRMTMTAVPLKIRRAYRWMLRRTRGDDPWGALTPRQIRAVLIDAVAGDDGEASAPSGEEPRWKKPLEQWEEGPEAQRVDLLLEMITAVIEETNFSGRHYETRDWEATREILNALVESLEADREAS